MNKKAGSGFAAFHDRRYIGSASVRVSNHVTVFQAEIFALLLAAKFICNNNIYISQHIRIYNDSRAAILAIKNMVIQSKLGRECIKELNKAGKFVNTLELLWVKAHVGIHGSEAADLLAKEALNA